MKKIKIVPTKWIPENHDVDWDGVPDRKDCKPFDKTQHGLRYEIIRKNGKCTVKDTLTNEDVFEGSEFQCDKFITHMYLGKEAIYKP